MSVARFDVQHWSSVGLKDSRVAHWQPQARCAGHASEDKIANLFVKECQLLGGRLFCLHKLDGHLIYSIHECLVYNAKTALAQPALLVLRRATDADVLPAT